MIRWGSIVLVLLLVGCRELHVHIHLPPQPSPTAVLEIEQPEEALTAQLEFTE